MNRMIPMSEKDFALMSRWASVRRTLNNVHGLLEDYTVGEPKDEGRMQIALDEFPMLIDAMEHVNYEAKQVRFKEELLKQNQFAYSLVPEERIVLTKSRWVLHQRLGNHFPNPELGRRSLGEWVWDQTRKV